MKKRMTATQEHSRPTGSGGRGNSGDTTGVIAVKRSGCLVHYTPAAARWLSGTGSLGLGDVWYAGLAEPARSRMQREWMMNRLEGTATNAHEALARAFCFENSDSTRQIIVEFAIPVGEASQADLMIGTVRVSYLEPGSWVVRSHVGDIDGTGDSDSPEVRSKMLRTIGHEMQQPIYAIQNYMLAAKQHLKTGQSEQVGEMLRKIGRQIVRAREFGDRLYQFASPPRQNPVPTSLHWVIESCDEMVQIFADDARATVRLDLRAAESTVVCDPVQMRHVVLNLIRNAADSLTLAQPDNRSIAIETENDAETIRVRIADSGPGVSDEVRERIFDHLFSTKESGLGMGLPYCHSVIMAHGGTLLLAENQPGRVVFEIRLPIKA